MARLLHLDDDPMFASLLSRWSAALGHSVASFADGAEALRAFEADPAAFDLVLTDMSMPGTSGLEFAQQILAIAPAAIVVISSGCEAPNWADHARDLGVADVVEKPESPEGLRLVLGRFLPPAV